MNKGIWTILLFMFALSVMAGSNESNIISISAHEVPYFSDYAKPIVEEAVNAWQEKGEFEKIAAWQKRVNETTRNAMIKSLTKECEKEYILMYSSLLSLNVTLGQYDSENEVFLLTDPNFGNMLVPVPISDGPTFKRQWITAELNPKYFIENDMLAIASLDITIKGLRHKYRYSNQASIKYEQARVDYNFNPIEIAASNAGAATKGQQTISERTITVGKSQVDLTIPETSAANPNTFVIVIANEDYKSVAKVPYALNDGRVFAKYCQRTLGVPAANIKVHENATYNDIRLAMAWLKNVCEKYEGEASVIFYYSGHGIPDKSDMSSYLLPVDGDGRYVTTGVKLDELYDKLGTMPAKSVTVLLDACFSGANRNGVMLATEKGVALKSKAGDPKGNMVVFAAAKDDETAQVNDAEGHGMFTYYVLKKLQDTKGDVNLQDLTNYVTREVSRQTAVSDKLQTPNVNCTPGLEDVWPKWKLK